MACGLPPEQKRITDAVERAGHGYVLRWTGELADEERARFLQQLDAVDFDRVAELAALITAPAHGPGLDGLEPAPVQRLPRNDRERSTDAQAVELGREALRAGRVAALTAAGGQGTRLGFHAPKGLFPITPIRGKSLFHILAAKVLAARRRYECAMPWLVMTSPTNDAETRAFFAQQDFFRLGADTVHFFRQRVNPILGADGRLLLAAKDRLLLGADGHGGVFEALAGSGVIDRMQAAGIDLISYFQVDNPLVTVADERYIGHHLRLDADFSCKVVRKRDPGEGLGAAVLRAGRPAVVEYIDLPPDMAAARAAEGELKYLFGSIAIHILGAAFARKVAGGGRLPWHVARKQYDVVARSGDTARVACFKFERFVFDALDQASACAFVEVERDREFAPVKNAEGKDIPDSARAMMRAEWIRWLAEAGVDVAAFDDPATLIEIDPLFADSAEELKAKLPPDWKPQAPVTLR